MMKVDELQQGQKDMMKTERLPVLDLYERYTADGQMFLTGAFGGVKICCGLALGGT